MSLKCMLLKLSVHLILANTEYRQHNELYKGKNTKKRLGMRCYSYCAFLIRAVDSLGPGR